MSIFFVLASSVSADEMNKFRSFSSKWWTPGGEYEALRALNDLRVPIVMRLLPQKKPIFDEYMPLENYKILDVGCGGGILAEVCNFYVVKTRFKIGVRELCHSNTKFMEPCISK